MTEQRESSPQSLSSQEKALSEALRFSLKILYLCIMVAAVFYLGSGLFVVPEGQAGLVSVAGKLLRNRKEEVLVYSPGTYFTPPPPVGRRILLPKQKLKHIETDAFWPGEKAEDRLRELRTGTEEKPLVPGRDGYVISGDGAVFHLRLRADYRIADAGRYYASFGSVSERSGIDTEAEKQVLKRLLEEAVVKTALSVRFLSRDAESSGKAGFFRRIRKEAASGFRSCGVNLTEVSPVVRPSEPEQVREAFVKGRKAASSAVSGVNKAERERKSRAAEAKARSEELIAGARVESGRIISEARQDVKRAGELSASLGKKPVLKKRAVFSVLQKVLRNADVRPVGREDGSRQYRISLYRGSRKKPEESGGKGK